MECPEEVRKRGAILYSNGFSGFQEPCESGSDKDHFILCWPHPPDENFSRLECVILPKISQRVGVASLRMGDWIGRDYLSIHWTEYPKRFQVLNELLVFGIPFQTQTQGMPYFKPRHGRFTPELLEERVMKQSQKLVKMGLYSMINHARCEEWNWTTLEGKEYARELRNLKEVNYDEKRENFYRWSLFQNYDEMSLLTLT